MKEIKVKKEFLNTPVGFGKTNKLLGEMSQNELKELCEIYIEGNDFNGISMFESGANKVKHLTYFRTANFKRFKKFEMDNIGQFNLIVGDNNVGKTSVLEALLVVESRKYFWLTSSYWNSILRSKDYKLSEYNNFYTIFLNEESPNKEIIFWFSKDDGPIYTIKKGAGLNIDIERNNLISAIGDAGIIPDDMKPEVVSNYFVSPLDPIGVNPNYVKPYISSFQRNSQELFTVFSQISDVTKDFELLINSLKIFLPDIMDVRIDVPTEDTKVFKVRLKNKSKTQILNAFGDGTQFIFEIFVKIFANRGKRLMIDELDTGIHYSRMKEYIKKVLEMANKLDVQLFMTTHSKECLEYYKTSLEELGTDYQKQACVIELNELNDKSVKSITHTYPEFARSVELENEIRGGY